MNMSAPIIYVVEVSSVSRYNFDDAFLNEMLLEM